MTTQEQEDEHAEKSTKTKINCELNCFAADCLIGILRNQIINHRLEKKLDLMTGEITQSEYDWHKSHAEFIEEEVAKQLFPNWENVVEKHK